MNTSISAIKIIKYDEGVVADFDDWLAKEEPLEIKLVHGPAEERKTVNVSITMRTPGNDLELAIGFLFTEGIISNINDINIGSSMSSHHPNSNSINIYCRENVVIDNKLLQRNFYTTSACGVCGKASIDAVFALTENNIAYHDVNVSKDIILRLPELLASQQNIFKHTGGLHAAAIFSNEGEWLLGREDVGRHNALDKLIGFYFLQSKDKEFLPKDGILLLSGRASFELLQKAAMAGIGMVCAVGAPSSLAVETAERLGITLVGFLKNNRFNIYSGSSRIQW